ncbi:MAG: cbb3-type cytochrome c oxidase subunit 3 [Rhodospirillales bacterium]|nr:cbb3-type cytochrome c oxidase subunit 3 [Rhodospirillales bacterium]
MMDWMALSEMARPFWGVWLMIAFLGIVVWAYWPKNKERFEQDARIVFEDDLTETDHG